MRQETVRVNETKQRLMSAKRNLLKEILPKSE